MFGAHGHAHRHHGQHRLAGRVEGLFELALHARRRQQRVLAVLESGQDEAVVAGPELDHFVTGAEDRAQAFGRLAQQFVHRGIAGVDAQPAQALHADADDAQGLAFG